MRRLMLMTAAVMLMLAPSLAEAAECVAQKAYSGGYLRVLEVSQLTGGVPSYTWHFRTVDAAEGNPTSGTIRVRVNGVIVDITGCDAEDVPAVREQLKLFADDINQGGWN